MSLEIIRFSLPLQPNGAAPIPSAFQNTAFKEVRNCPLCGWKKVATTERERRKNSEACAATQQEEHGWSTKVRKFVNTCQDRIGGSRALEELF